MVLLTAMPPSRQPGAVPAVPVIHHLARRLIDRGERVRVLVPESEAADWPEDIGLHIGAVTDSAAFTEAVSDTDRVFLAGLVGESLLPLRALTNALIAGDVERVVLLGSHGSDFEDEISEETWQWSAFERSLDTHGISWAYLRPTAVMGNALVGGYPIPGSALVETIRNHQNVHEYLPDAPYAFIHEADLAEIAAIILSDNEYRGSIDVSGTTATATERHTMLGAALGVETKMIELSADQAANRWRNEGWPEDTIAVMLYALPAFAAHPDNPALRGQEQRARTLLGRAPRTFQEWADELVDPDAQSDLTVRLGLPSPPARCDRE
ncbi:NAD(P)H-binding protein [Nocardia mexicana]|uniref:Uncharacterized protein YbjT (DUF2867 family) n=1 Tax=Nocardia mexicana TaxID=279262 RepID=A0A370H1T5_9NOCA|nr:NAD(P)H-binding protein [Nocardia mexicana]RDI49923.1 uncharacterized protein YbjT (DUF2867 family) [Nocardia mexicana]